MLNISKNTISKQVDSKKYTSLNVESGFYRKPAFIRLIVALSVLAIVILLLPWTQFVRGNGKVTALRPDQRPQTIQNTIAGKITKWYVREGELVDVGDTILFLSEINTEYFDPLLIDRVKEQVNAKASAITAYEDKLMALDQQIQSLNNLERLTIQAVDNEVIQAKLKVTTDSAAWMAAQLELKTLEQRLERQEQLYEEGLVSLTDLESRRLKVQASEAKLVKAQNEYSRSVNEYINSLIKQDQVVSEFAEKTSEVRSKRSTAGTELFDGLADMAKMKNQLANYQLRNDMYYVLSPIKGYVTQALQVGIGENLKENTALVTIVPKHWDKAVEIYVKPIDLPLISKGNEVMLLFDGWPSVVFSGWPDLGYGTFPGEVIAVDYDISDNGMYRILVSENGDTAWPEQLKAGSGSRAILLLNDVPLWYELWRQLNGFPPDYYKKNEE